MDKAEYDSLYKTKGIRVVDDIDNPLESKSISVDGSSVAPLNIKVISSNSSDRYTKEMKKLGEEKIEVIGKIKNGVDIIRRTGGADHRGNDAWIQLMRRCGRIR